MERRQRRLVAGKETNKAHDQFPMHCPAAIKELPREALACRGAARIPVQKESKARASVPRRAVQGNLQRHQVVLAELALEDPKRGMRECKQIRCNLAKGTFGTRTTSKPSPQPIVTEEIEAELQQAWDDVSGHELDAGKVRKARGEEVAYIHKTNLHTTVPRSKAADLGAKIISVSGTFALPTFPAFGFFSLLCSSLTAGP